MNVIVSVGLACQRKQV